MIQGYHIPLNATPGQRSRPYTPHLPTRELAFLEDEIQTLVQKQAVQEVPVTTKGYYSNMFMVPKKDGGQRPAINLKSLNKYMKSEHLRMEGLHTVNALIQKSNLMAKVDLKDAFFIVQVAPQRHHLLFNPEKKTFQFKCLPFGLCTAPRAFIKILKPTIEAEINGYLPGSVHGRWQLLW